MAHKRNRFLAVFFVGHLGLERKGDGSVCEQNRPLRDVDGRGVAFVTNYDYLGRVTTESATQSGWTETITRIYGTSGTGQMHLISESLGSWTKNYEYDTYGKVISETMTYGTDITRTKTYQYDSSNGLLSRKTLSEGVTTTRYYYVSGADGLVGLHTEKDAPSGTVTNNYVLITDHLGSITMMADYYDDYNEIRYDVWGNRTVQESFLDEVIDRGYTGHEHLDQLGLIDMKGRMYDPRLGRFLSPDPFVQAPTDPQNYNRYSYCLNNPLKYTDPSGNVFWESALIGAIFSANLNVALVGMSGNINSIGDVYLAAGFGAVSSIYGCCYGSCVLSALGQATTLCGDILNGVLSGAVGGAIGGAIAGGGNALLCGGDLANGVGKGALFGALSGALLGGICSGVQHHKLNACYAKGCKTLGIEKGSSIEPTDVMLKKAQEAWYPDAPMEYVKKFTVENVPDKVLEGLLKETAFGQTVPDRIDGTNLMSGYSDVYFNPEAFKNAKYLFYTMGHEFVHVSQINAMMGSSSFNVKIMDYWAYDFQNSIGGGDMIGPATRIELQLNRFSLYGLPDVDKLNWTHFSWVNNVNFVYPF